MEPVGRVGQPGVLVLGEIEVGGGGVRLQLSHARRARDGDDVRPADHPRQRHLRRRGVVGGSDVPQRLQQVSPALHVLGQEQRVGRADAAWRVPAVVLPRQEPLSQRAVGDDQAVALLGPRQHVVLGLAHDEAVLHLVAQHWSIEGAFRLLPPAQREVADTDVADHPGALQPAHPPHRRGDRNDGVRPMDLVKVDAVDTEPVGAGQRPLLHDRRQRQHGEDLGGEERAVPPRRDRLADDALRLAEAVDLGGVDVVDPEVERPMDDSDDFGAPRAGGRTHQGNDLMGAKLDHEVAVVDGTVSWVRIEDGTGISGNMLKLTAKDGWFFYYIHINNDTPGTDDGANPAEYRFAPGIGEGSKVKAGDLIAYMGDSGDAESTGPHLHFEVHQPDGTPVDPYTSLRL